MMERGEKLPTAPPGRCRVCDELRPNRRRSFCSDECRDGYYLVTASDFLRFKVFARDRGVCASCGIDCDALEVRLWGVSTMMKLPRRQQLRAALYTSFDLRKLTTSELMKFGFRLSPATVVTLWQADHVVPLIDGGGWGVDNVQTVCTACHFEKTASEATTRAKRKKLVGSKQLATMRALRKRGLL